MSFIDQLMAARGLPISLFGGNNRGATPPINPSPNVNTIPDGGYGANTLLPTGVVRPQVNMGLMGQVRQPPPQPWETYDVNKPGDILPQSYWGAVKQTVSEIGKPKGDKFTRVLRSVREKEGGYQDFKADPGNYDPTTNNLVGTNYGISARKLAEWYGRPVTRNEMINLDESVANKIYKEEYYDKFNIEKLPDNLQNIVMNATVLNEGGGVETLQKLLRQKGAKNISGQNKGKLLDIDGRMGPNTKAAMKNAKFTKEQFKNMYLLYLRNNNKKKTKTGFTGWQKFGKGWTNRFEDLSK